jgi:uncharacterized membrane protein YGL010W
MLKGVSLDEWIARYEQGHRHPVNRACHLLGIPMIAVSLALALVAFMVRGLWPAAIGMFVLGWVLQFIGHAFERKPPEFFKDWRFLLVGLRWWARRIMGGNR